MEALTPEKCSRTWSATCPPCLPARLRACRQTASMLMSTCANVCPNRWHGRKHGPMHALHTLEHGIEYAARLQACSRRLAGMCTDSTYSRRRAVEHAPHHRARIRTQSRCGRPVDNNFTHTHSHTIAQHEASQHTSTVSCPSWGS